MTVVVPEGSNSVTQIGSGRTTEVYVLVVVPCR
jgi:hypothetical protein